MRCAVLVLCATALLLSANGAAADTLQYAHGGKVQGTLEEITFRMGDVPGMYPRDLIRAIELRDEGKDVVVLGEGIQREGKLVTARFKSAEGVITLTRSKLKALVIGDDPSVGSVTPAKPDAAPGKTASGKGEDQDAVENDDVSAEDLERREVLGQNHALARAAFDKADQMREEAVEKLKKEHLRDAEKVVKEMDSLESTIKGKLKRRRDAEQRYNYNREREGIDYTRRHRAPDFSNDGVEKDMRDYKNAKKRKSHLKDLIDDAMKKIELRRAIRKRRVRVAYELHKKQIIDGEKLTEDGMKEKYFAALDLERKGGKDDKVPQSAFEGKRKENPFDEMFKDKREAPERWGKKTKAAKETRREKPAAVREDDAAESKPEKKRVTKDEFEREFE